MTFNLESVNSLKEACELYQSAYEDAVWFAEKWQISIEEINELVLPELKEKILSLKDNMLESFNYNLSRINELNTILPWIDEEIKRLQDLKKSYQWEIDRKKSWIQFCMEATGTEKIETALNKLSFRSSESVFVSEWIELSDEFVRIKREPDKTKIKDFLKTQWWEIDWCYIVTNKNLIIK